MSNEDRYYRELYLGEVKEHIARLNAIFLHLEKNKEDSEAINEAFREMHTIKGDSAMMGLEKIANLAHEAEDILADLKERKRTVSTSTIDLLLGYVDKISILVEDFAATTPGSTNPSSSSPLSESSKPESHETAEALKSNSDGFAPKISTAKIKDLEEAIGKIHASMSRVIEDEKKAEFELKTAPIKSEGWSDLGEKSGQSRTGTGPDSAAESSDKIAELDGIFSDSGQSKAGAGHFRITILTEIEKPLRPVRAFMILKTLVENGVLLQTDPPNEQLANGEFENAVKAEVSTNDVQSLIESLKGIPGVKELKCEPLSLDGGVPSEKSLLAEKIVQIDQLVSCFETQGKEESSATIRADSTKGKHRVEEIRVNIGSLDRLFNLAGELVLAKSRLGNIVKQLGSPELKEVHRLIDGTVSDLQNEVMNLRLMPIGQVFGIFPRMVRDMSKSLSKEIDLIVEGGDTAIDRKILEEIMDPVVHIVRNCIDHGIETTEERVRIGKAAVGTIKISASRDASHFILDIEDDGKGIDPKAVRETAVIRGLISSKKAESMTDEEALGLICVPGFSMKKEVSELSGRGMGMSAVKSKIESFGGSLSIKSEVGKGTTITMRLPASMATLKVIIVGVGSSGQLYAIPVIDILEIVEIKKEEIRFIHGAPFINLRGNLIRLYRLAWLLGIDEGVCNAYVVIIIKRGDDRNYGLLVSEVRDEDEVAMKPIPKILREVRGFLGSAILGDGKPTFVIDVMTIAKDK